MKKIVIICIGLFFSCFDSYAQISFKLLINGLSEDTLRPGDPILLELQAFNSVGEHAQVHNSAVQQNILELDQQYQDGVISKEEYDVERSIFDSAMIEMERIYLPNALTSSKPKLTLLHNDKAINNNDFLICTTIDEGDKIEVIPGNRYFITVGIPPETTATWNAGNNKISIQLDTLKTDSVSVFLNSSGNQVNHEESLLELADFYFWCSMPNKALDIATGVIQSHPNSIAAVIIKADILMDLEKYTEAKTLYQNALNMFYKKYPNSYEPPEYLLDMIEETSLLIEKK